MHIDAETLARSIQGAPQCRLLAVTGIQHGGGKFCPHAAQMGDEFQGQRGLGFAAAVSHRNARLLATRRILAPLRRQVEPCAHQRDTLSLPARGKHRDLATDRREIDRRRLPRRGERSESIVDLAKAAVVLACHAD